MNPFYRPQITDELLSAYIDGDVTVEERNLIEKTIQRDADLAWRLESLQQTVGLLRSLPELSLPRSFLLSAADVTPKSAPIPRLVVAAPNPAKLRKVKPRFVEADPPGFWQSFFEFWRGGSPLLRNMAMTGLTIWLVLFGATLLNPIQLAVNTGNVNTGNADGQTMAAPQAPQAESAVAFSSQPVAAPVAVAPVEVALTEVVPTEVTQGVETLAQSMPVAAEQSTQPPVDQSTQSAALAFSTQTQTTQLAEPAAGMSGGGEDAAATTLRLQEQPAVASMAESPIQNQADPLAQAMSDTGDSAIGAAAVAAPINNDSAITAATSDSSSAAKQAGEAPPVEENIPAVNAQVVTNTEAVESAPTAQPVPAQAAAVAPAAISPTAPSAPIQAMQQEPVAQVVVPVVEPTVAPTPTQLAVVAFAQPDANMAPAEAKSRPAGMVEQVAPTPLFDPVRIQLAQLLVALVTAVLGIFWLASQWGKRRG